MSDELDLEVAALDEAIAEARAELEALRKPRIAGDLVNQEGGNAGDTAGASPTSGASAARLTAAERAARANAKRPPAGWLNGAEEPWRQHVGPNGVITGGGALSGVSNMFWGPI
jgi:hypothetical protein